MTTGFARRDVYGVHQLFHRNVERKQGGARSIYSFSVLLENSDSKSVDNVATWKRVSF